MTELQAEVAPAINDTPIEPTTQEGAAPAPASDENHEQKIEFSEGQQAHINDLMGKKTFKYRESERQHESQVADLKRQLEETQAKIPQLTRPPIPEIDPYSETLEQDLVKRDDAVRAQAKFDRDESDKTVQAEQTQAQSVKIQQEATDKLVKTYNDRATQLGVNVIELQADEATVMSYGIDQDVANFILADDQGPLIVKYLAKNPLEMEVLRGLTPQHAAIRIHTDIKGKASALGVKTPTAPTPVETLSGSGMPLKERGPSGATYT